MAKPTVSKANPPQFDNDVGPNTLHKKQNPNKNRVLITGSNMSVGDSVTVTGKLGTSPTIWTGTIGTDMGGGKYLCKNLNVIQEQTGAHRTSGGGTEDVSTTVTNSDGTSTPSVTTTNVNTVP